MTRTASGSPVLACIRPRLGGGAVLAIEKGFALQDPDGTVTALEPLWDGPVRMNEGAVCPDGSFCSGTMAYDRTPGAAAMWRLDPSGQTRQLWDGVTISNGLDFSPDRSRAYYVDTPTGRVDVWDWEDGRGLVERRRFADLRSEAGSPDGLTVDAEGHVWVAMNGAGRVLCLGDDGSVLERVEVAARQTTACTFGGRDLAALVITTSREGLGPSEDPAAGSLFHVQPGVRGQAEELLFGC